MDLSIIVLQQVVIIVLLMLVGYIAKKTKIIGAEGVSQFTSFLMYFVTPCVLIEAYQKPFNVLGAKLLLVAFIMAILIHAVTIVFSNLVFRKKQSTDYRVNRFAVVYSNCGFMAIPLLSAALGSEGVFFGSAYLAVFSILNWTHGIYTYTENKTLLSFKKAVLNPGVLGTLISLILFVCSIKLPDILGQTVGFVADMNTPLSMIMLGTFFVGIKPLEILKNISFYIVVVIRLILVPVMAIFLLKLFGIDMAVVKALAISSACPVAGITALWAGKFNLNAEYASQLVAITTVLSVISIPAVLLLL